MGNSSKPDKRSIGKGSSKTQGEKVADVLKVMTEGKYRNPTILGESITESSPYPFDKKGDLTKASDLLESMKTNLERVANVFEALEKFDISNRLDRGIRKQAAQFSVESAHDLVLANSVRAGTTSIVRELLGVLSSEMEVYQSEILDAKENWPKKKNKSRPIHIATEIAKEYVKYMGQKPTYGTVSADNVQTGSTSFSRAVEDIFAILEVQGNPFEAAKDAANMYTAETAAEAQKAFQQSMHPFYGSGNRKF